MKKSSLTFLESLLHAPSPSGYEGPARKIWVERAKRFSDEVSVDVHGNAIATLNPTGFPHVMLAGHIDEIGFQICFIDDKGFLRFRPIGGHDLQVIEGRRVHIHTRSGPILGVIGKKPIHLIRDRSRATKPKAADLWIDAGFADRDAAERVVDIGDPATYIDGFAPLRDKLAVARAFDNKVGAFIVLEALAALSESGKPAGTTKGARRKGSASKLKAKVSAVATVQEEVGLRGAHTSAYGLNADVGIAVDVTWATDDPSAEAKEIGEVKLGHGPVLTRGPNANPPLFALLQASAKRDKIAVQIRALPGGSGTDGNAMQLSRGGMATAVLSVPQRYMHSPVEICHLGDIEAAVTLIANTIKRFTKQTSFIPSS